MIRPGAAAWVMRRGEWRKPRRSIVFTESADSDRARRRHRDFSRPGLGAGPARYRRPRGSRVGSVIWIAVTAGTALAALTAFALFLRARRDDRFAAAQNEMLALRAKLDRTEALLDADDQRTIIWDSAVTAPQVFGGLPERVGAPSDRAGVPRLRQLARHRRAPRSSKRPPTSSAARASASRLALRAQIGTCSRRSGGPAASARSCASAS